MNVTRAMLDKDLQRSYRPLSMLASLFKYRWFVGLFNLVLKRTQVGRDTEGMQCEETFVPSSDGSHTIRLRIYRPLGVQGDLPAMLYIHGGGYITGVPEMAADTIKSFIDTRPCVVVAPDYRKAHEHPFPRGFNDCYDTLLWTRDSTEQLKTTGEIVVAGHSAGGGLTAAVTLKARDTGDVQISFQMPIYPMIDDTQPSDPKRDVHSPVWSTTSNRAGWSAYLSELNTLGAEIPTYAAPARNTDYAGFPPTITFVGTLEPFYQETIAYVQALESAGIAVAFRSFEGCFHAFEDLVPDAQVSKEATSFMLASFADFYDRYLSATPTT